MKKRLWWFLSSRWSSRSEVTSPKRRRRFLFLRLVARWTCAATNVPRQLSALIAIQPGANAGLSLGFIWTKDGFASIA